jgi:hypothetical protein
MAIAFSSTPPSAAAATAAAAGDLREGAILWEGLGGGFSRPGISVSSSKIIHGEDMNLIQRILNELDSKDFK